MEITIYLKLSNSKIPMLLHAFIRKQGPNKNQLKIEFKGPQSEHE